MKPATSRTTNDPAHGPSYGHDFKFWVVTNPRPCSTIADICFEASLRDLELQFRGGLQIDENPTLFTDQRDALVEAQGRLAAMGGQR